MAKYWEYRPIVAWAIDKYDVIKKACQDSGVDLDYEVERYGDVSYNDKIEKIFTSSPFKLNLGGETERFRLSFTDKPIGVFNFSLASRSLYPLTEYYSKDLAEQDPNRFESLGLLSGIVPADMVDKKQIGNVLTYIFKDKLKDKEYLVEKRVKGQTAINDGVPNAKLKYASKEKKVYQYIKRRGGKVKYVEIYSLFYYTSLSGNFQYAVRHLPAMMCAEYLEKQGIKVRFYMTRFVLASKENISVRKVSNTGVDLPMGQQNFATKNRYLVVQPIIAKDFQQDFDKRFALCLSSESRTNIYDACASYSVRNDMQIPSNLMGKYVLPNAYIYGDPDWSQEQYWEGVERFRNKYQEYVKLGIFESKEVLPMAMIFFHDQSIANYFANFSYAIRYNINKYENMGEVDVFLQPDVNRFFVWWMRTSGNTIKHKINLINSTNFLKDLREIENDILVTQQELSVIINETTNVEEKKLYLKYGKNVIKELNIIDSSTIDNANPLGKIDLKLYINSFINELTTFADNGFFPTPEDEVENRLNLKKYVFDELKKV